MLTKLARFDDAEILDVKGSQNRRTASINKLGEFDEFQTEDGFLYARIRAISSRVNKNFDGWPSVELAGGQDIFDRHSNVKQGSFTVEATEGGDKYGFATFLGKPIFVDHHNSDPSRARGVIVDAKLHVEDFKTASEHDSYYSSSDVDDSHLPPTWVELLLEVDAKQYPRLAKAILDGSKNPNEGIDGFSMGTNIEKSTCSICSHVAHTADEFCKHIKLGKGAKYDWVNPKTGRKQSRTAYENCHGVQFFELSAVFDPADETALLREVIHKEGSKTADHDNLGGRGCGNCGAQGMIGDKVCPVCGGHNLNQEQQPAVIDVNMQQPQNVIAPGPPQAETVAKVAESVVPQSEAPKAPAPVDTLREEKICKVCGSEMDTDKCSLCGWVSEPEGLDDPDLDKAQEINPEIGPQPEEEQIPRNQPEQTQGFDNPDLISADAQMDLTSSAKNTPFPMTVKGDMAKWTVTAANPRVAGRVNPVEKPITTSTEPATEEPKEEVLSDATTPVMKRAKTQVSRKALKDFVEAAKLADSRDEAASADAQVDVVGTGGVINPSNEGQSADAQVDVTGRGSTGVDSVSADEEGTNVHGSGEPGGFDSTKTTDDSGPTKTWHGQERQTDPVTSDVFPAHDEGVKAVASTKEALDSAPFPKDDEGLSGGTAVQGVQPADPVGTTQRVNVLEPTTTPEGNNSGPTTTWSGTGGNKVLRQQDPVTNKTLEGSEGVTSARIISAFKLADLEVELGLTQASDKYARVAELEQKSPEVIAESIQYVEKIKTAGLHRQARVAKRMPSLSRVATVSSSEESPSVDESLYL